MKKGVIYAFAAYGLWGLFPIYFKLIKAAPADQILCHRIVWSVVFLAIVLSFAREWGNLRRLVTGRILLVYAGAAALLAINWYTYIWAVNSNFVIEASLGYFINPLVNVLLGVIFLKEKLKKYQWIAIGIAAVGVGYLAIALRALPWIPLTLALSFGLYGLSKKTAPLNALHGLSLETGALFIPALAYLLFVETQGSGAFGHVSWGVTLLLSLAGVVTAVPLLLFAGAAHRIPLSTMGFIQYITPTLQFLAGLLLFREDFSQHRLIGFSIIWLALAWYVVNTVIRGK